VEITVTDKNDNAPVLSQESYSLSVSEAAIFNDVVGKVRA